MMKTTLMISLLLFATLIPASTMALGPTTIDAPDSQACAEHKPDNSGTGGDKYSTCDRAPESGKRVNFICASPSANAISVVANDPQASAKGKLSCDGDEVASCSGKVQCAGAGDWDRPYGAAGGIGDGSCQGGTEEMFDSGMTWACASVGVGLCRESECADEKSVERAKQQVQEAVNELTNHTRGVSPGQLLDRALLYRTIYQLESLALGFVSDSGDTIGAICDRDSCQLTPVYCNYLPDSIRCSIVPAGFDDPVIAQFN